MRFWFWRRREKAKLLDAVVPDAQRLLFGAAPAGEGRLPPALPEPAPPALEVAPPPETAALLASQLADAAALVASGLVEAGLAAYERIVVGEPHCAEAWFRVGILRQELGDVRAALRAWESAVACDPAHWLAGLRLATACEGLDRGLLAVRHLTSALSHAPHLGELSIHLSTIYGRLGWWDRAREVLEALERPLPGWWEQAARNAETTLDAFGFRLAALELKSAGGEPATFADRLEAASILRATGRLAESEPALRALLDEQPANWRVHAELAALLKRTQGASAAIAYLRGLDARLTGSDAYALTLARLMHEAGDSDAARLLLLGKVADRPEPEFRQPELCRACATMALAAGDEATFDQAVRAWLAADGLDSWASRFAIASARRSGSVARLHNAAVAAEPATPMPVIQFWGQLPPPEDVAETMASWHLLNPTLPHITFDSAGARAFIADCAAPEVLECFDAARHPAMQSDIFRLVFLGRHGGLYVDADEVCRRPIDDLLRAMRRVKLAA